VKTSAALSLFFAKYPWKFNEVRKVIVPLLKYVPLNQAKKVILITLYKGAATRLVNKYGEAVIPDLVVVAEKHGNLEKTLGVAKRDNDVRWLEEGTSTWGWTHIKDRHLADFINMFGYKTDDKIEEMIFDTIKSGTIEAKVGDQYKYTKDFLDVNGKLQRLHVVVSDKSVGIGRGNIVTAFPEKIN